MTTDPVVRNEDRGRVRLITINRPAALNAMNNAVFDGIAEALAEAEASAGTAVAVITGEGRAFSAGQDLEEARTVILGDETSHRFPAMLRRLTTFPKPLVAAVNGIGVGIGMTMLAHCDLVLMDAAARLRTPFPQLGLAPEAASSWSFVERMGWQQAAYTLLSGRWFSATECLDMGLVWRISEPGAVLDDALAVAAELAANPIPSLLATKQLMLAGGRPQAAWAAHEREMAAYTHLQGAPANVEAFAAFAAKREPDFTRIPGI